MAVETGDTDWYTWVPLGVMLASVVPLAVGAISLTWTGVLNREGPLPAVLVSSETGLVAAGFTLLVVGLLALESVALRRGADADLDVLIPTGIVVGTLGLVLGLGPGLVRTSPLGPLPSALGAVALLANGWFGAKRYLRNETDTEFVEARNAVEPTGPDVPREIREDLND